VPDHPRELYIAGTGSFALEVVEYAQAAGRTAAGLVELIDPARVGSEIHGLDVVALSDERGAGGEVVIGTGGDRLGYWGALAEHGWRPAMVVHPKAHISPSVVAGDGLVVGPGAIVGASSELGPHVLVGRGALIGHHVRIGAGATLNPGVNIAGNVVIGEGATIGMGAVITNSIEVGPGAIVAAGAVVIRQVEAETRVQGIPARVFSPG
jgi:sugar O-acyltransferase (sialic acid O-acetyltransferase NeuD family)